MNKINQLTRLVGLLLISGSVFATAPAQVPATGEVGGAAGATNGVAWPSQRFVAGSGATADCITDKLTGLMWPKNGSIGFSNGSSPYTPLATPELSNTNAYRNKVTWSGTVSSKEVFTAITNLNTEKLCGYSDWRLPNKVELKSLINYGAVNPADWLMYGTGNVSSTACDGACFTNVQADFYWSSSSYAPNTNNAWCVDFNDGDVSANYRDSSHYVWPVRSAR